MLWPISIWLTVMKTGFQTAHLVRIGTSGGMQPEIPLGSFLISEKINRIWWYAQFLRRTRRRLWPGIWRGIKKKLDWNKQFCAPCVVDADAELTDRIGRRHASGCDYFANGFYGPQGRGTAYRTGWPRLNDKIEEFRFDNYKINQLRNGRISHCRTCPPDGSQSPDSAAAL